MATELHDKLTFINEEKNKKILPENIKKGIKIFNVEGVADVLDTSDANATASDLLQGKSAYVQGTKIEGTIPSIETLTIKPELETEQTTEYNAKVGSVTVPSLIDMTSAYSDPTYKAGSMGGGPRASSCSTTVTTVPGGTIAMCLLGRATMSFSTPGWELIFTDRLITSEGYTQDLSLYTKQATGTSEALTVTGSYSERCAVCLLSFDSLVEYEKIWSFNSGTSQGSSVTIDTEIQKYDILIGQGFWGGTVSFSGPPYAYFNRCSDGGRLGVMLASGYATSARMSCDSSQRTCFVARMKAGLNTDDIRKGKKFLGMTGTFTEDADATAADIMTGKTAYVNGVKIVGDIATLGEEVQVTATDATVSEDNTKFIISSETPSSGVLSKGATYQITADGNQVMDALSLAPDMLRSGVNILGVEGTYGADVGEFNAKYETDGLTSELTPSVLITTIQGMNTEGVVSANSMFSGLTRLKSLPEMNLSSTTTMTSMCANCYNIIYAPNYDIPNCTSMISSFYNCQNLPSINFTNSNKVTDFTQTFMNCYSMTSMPIMNYNAATSFINTFTSTGLKNTVDMSVFARSGSSYSFTNTFYNCHNITAVENFIKLGAGSSAFLYTYRNCSNLISVNDCQFLNMYNTYYMFQNCWNLREMNNCIWTFLNPNYYSSYNNHTHMFGNCVNLMELGDSFWTNLKVSQMNYMFYNCQNLKFPNDWVLNVWGYNFYNSNMCYTFFNCRQLENITLHYTNMANSGTTYYCPYLNNTFTDCVNLHTVNIHNMVMNYNHYLTLQRPFRNCPNLTNIIFSNMRFKNNAVTGASFGGIASGSGITSINNVIGVNLFESNQCVHMFSGCTKLYDLGTEYMNFWRVNNFNDMFADCVNLKNINQSQINMDNAVSINAMFAGCDMNNFENWNWPKVTSATYLFSRGHFGTINNVELPACTNAMYMFQNATIGTLGKVNLGKVSAAYYMFNNANIDCIDGLSVPATTQAWYLWWGANINTFKNISLGNLTNYGEFFNKTYIGNTSSITENTFPNISNAYYMFRNSRIEHIDNMGLRINGYSYFLFQNSLNLLTINNLTLNLQNAQTAYLCYHCRNLQSVDGIYFPNQMNLYQAFYQCTNLTSVNNISSPTGSGSLSYAFQECTSLQTAHNLYFPLGSSYSYMFYNCGQLHSVTGLNYSNARLLDYTFHMCHNMRTLGPIDCDQIYRCNTILGHMNNLENFGGFINLGNNFWTNSQYNSYQYLYLNYFPNLSQQSMFNIVNNLFALVNYSNIYVTQNQYNLLDTEHRQILSNKHWRLNRLSV